SIPFGARGTSLTERDVVLDGATLIGMAGDANVDVGIRHQHGNLRIECGARVITQLRPVEVEVNHGGDCVPEATLLARGRSSFIGATNAVVVSALPRECSVALSLSTRDRVANRSAIDGGCRGCGGGC